MSHQIDINHHLMVVTTTTVDRLLGECPDALLLYMFYYRTALRQGTLAVKATPGYCRKGLKWGDGRMKKADKALRDLNLIEKITRRSSDGRVLEWFVRIKYVQLSPEPTKWENPPGGETTRQENPPGGKQGTNTKRSEVHASRDESKEEVPPLTPPKQKLAVKADEFIDRWNRFANGTGWVTEMMLADPPTDIENETRVLLHKRLGIGNFSTNFDDIFTELAACTWIAEWKPSLLQFLGKNKDGVYKTTILLAGGYRDRKHEENSYEQQPFAPPKEREPAYYAKYPAWFLARFRPANESSAISIFKNVMWEEGKRDEWEEWNAKHNSNAP